MNRAMGIRKRPISQTLVTGGMAGLAGACAMSRFTQVWKALISKADNREKETATRQPYSEQEWDSTTRIAEITARRLFKRHLNAREKRIGAAMVHYAVGATTGAAYAILARKFPEIRKSSGAIFGVALWLLADELLMPAMGATRKLKDYSLLAQANALGEHVVYAVTANTLLPRKI